MVQPIPEGYPQVTPYLIVYGASAAIEFYATVLGATERMRMAAPDDKVGHAELRIGDSLIMLADEHPEMGARGPRAVGGTPVSLHVYVEDSDAVFQRAVQSGAKALRPVEDKFLRRPLGRVRGSLRTPVERRHPRRGRPARRDGQAGGRGRLSDGSARGWRASDEPRPAGLNEKAPRAAAPSPRRVDRFARSGAETGRMASKGSGRGGPIQEPMRKASRLERARRWPGRLRAPLLRFGVRLGLSLMLALTAACAFAYWLVSRNLEQQSLSREATVHRADARVLVDAGVGARSPQEWKAEVSDRLHLMQRRPGTLEAILVDENFRVVAAGDDRLVGLVDRTARLAQVLAGGSSWVGHEADQRRDRRDFEFLQPLRLPGGRYAFEITTAGEFFDSELSAIRDDLILAAIAAWLAAIGVFWLTGGRSVLRAHRFALQRATRDGLTDLANHRAFQSELRRAGTLAGRYGEPLALIMIDLDGFKFANDRHGHRFGDACLRKAARVLSSGRAGDQAFRVGGDEFALLLPHTDAEGAGRVAERMRKKLAAEDIRVSLGVGQLRPGQAAADLREEVDAALYEAKRRGGGRVVAFDEIAARVSVMTSARSAALDSLLADGGVDVAFQPIWDLRAEGSLLGFEALARPHARYGFDGPAEVFDAAQQLGRLYDLDLLCVERILARAHEVPSGALLFINVSPQTLDIDADGDPWLVRVVEDANLDPSRIVVEVTERVGSRTNLVIQTLRRLHDHGFRIAIDDIGTGNSGLQMLRETHADYIKIDRSIVAGASADRNARGILLAMAAFAHQTGSYVVAEGIEDEEVLRFILGLETDSAAVTINGGQGYGLGRPAAHIPEPADVAPHDLLTRARRAEASPA